MKATDSAQTGIEVSIFLQGIGGRATRFVVPNIKRQYSRSVDDIRG